MISSYALRLPRLSFAGRSAVVAAVLAALLWSTVAPAMAQEPSRRQLRTYIPPEQLVSFLPTTPFDQFVEFLNPLFVNVTGKQVIDPESRSEPIGVSVTRMQFFDAFELVLEAKGLSFRETDRYFIVQEGMPMEDPAMVQQQGPMPSAPAVDPLPATLETPEVVISALLFEVNLSRARELGLDWSVFIGQQTGQQGDQQGDDQGPRFKLRPKNLGGAIGDFFREDELSTPDEIDFGDLARFFRALEDDGIGKTLAQPSVAVQSREQGRIQIGSDIPIQVRDFAGNTITQFISTGIIVDVTPTLISEALADTAGSPEIAFVHLDVNVERSSGRPFGASIAVDRNTADTQVLLLDGEQTVIGGLYSSDIATSRRGIPLLKDLPPWVFGLRYVFGREQKTIARRELVIVLQAEVLDPIPERARKSLPDQLLEQRRKEVQERIRRFDDEVNRRLGPDAVLPSKVDD
ncbi:MAG: general secretion pathway protein GspD [Bacteroidetes bacterium]|jgi:type IV pilus assembly protein PilQ|nr:general secretion pathway protein GspD [Bacteroidota bacterium]